MARASRSSAFVALVLFACGSGDGLFGSGGTSASEEDAGASDDASGAAGKPTKPSGGASGAAGKTSIGGGSAGGAGTAGKTSTSDAGASGGSGTGGVSSADAGPDVPVTPPPDAPPPPPPPPPPPATKVWCGPDECDVSAGNACCLRPEGFPFPVTVTSCEPVAKLCSTRVTCDSNADCTSGFTCCAVRGGLMGSGPYQVIECREKCDGTSTPVECGKPSDCPGAMCCGDWNQLPPFYRSTKCAPTCEGGDITFCDSDAQCASGQHCKPSSYLPGSFAVCATQGLGGGG